MPGAGFDNLLDRCLDVRTGERVLLLTDEGSDREVVSLLSQGIERRGATAATATMPKPRMPGAEPPDDVSAMMLEAGAVIELTSLFVGSSMARRRATEHGVRYVTMPAIRLETFRDGGPLAVDFDAIQPDAERVGAAWTNATRFQLSTPAGTHLTGSVEGRPGRVLDGLARSPGAYSAPPDIEAGTAPVEGTTSGVAVIDGDLLFMGEGPLRDPVVIEVRDGLVVRIDGPEAHRLTDMVARCNDPQMSNLAEVSKGLNPWGQVCSVPMETESSRGTAHIALGNSIAYGGIVNAAAHLDCVMRDATLELDGSVVISRGVLE
jgi:leucyl aminopeptidase (aminopeptidase T)